MDAIKADLHAEEGMRRVTVLGSTGSVGCNTIDLIERNRDRYEIEALTANNNVALLIEQARRLKPRQAVIADEKHYATLKEALSGTGVEAGAGLVAVVEAADRPADWVMAAIVGAAGLRPTLAAVRRGAVVALANKECLVSAGRLFMRAAKAAGATLLPLDSEHNAIFQVLTAGPREAIERITLTASGGPFRTYPLERIARAGPEEALRHPNWSMGAKISIDSATLMNKGLELIEAHHLFEMPPAQLDVLVHPQSVVHALVTFRDGGVVAGLSVPDMRVPIAYCLGWPDRLAWEAPRLDLAALGSLNFELPDLDRFPALRIARAALEAGGAMPTVLNAANEVAVGAFLARQIGFLDIAAVTENAMERAVSEGLGDPATVEEALAIDHIGRSLARTLLPQFAAKAS
jgi:1-deoxy-D-xylulose-5-phosphate reductoisomerase